jgi:hypothetical protein
MEGKTISRDFTGLNGLWEKGKNKFSDLRE